jgi:hypothetical protein
VFTNIFFENMSDSSSEDDSGSSSGGDGMPGRGHSWLRPWPEAHQVQQP